MNRSNTVTFTAPDGSVVKETFAFPTADLPEQKDKLAAEFPGWTVDYKVIIDGHTWAMPRGVRWTAVNGDRTVTAGSDAALRAAIGRVTTGTARSLTCIGVECSLGFGCNVAGSLSASYDSHEIATPTAKGIPAMAPPRTFRYELLRDLIREHPDWPYARLARVLTEDVRKTDPYALDVTPDAVRRVVHDYRDRWEREGTTVPDRRLGNDIRVPLSRVSENYWMATPTRYLRELWNARQGLPPVGDSGKDRRRAVLRWEARLRETGQIVDITSLGEVIVRPASPGELDEDGNLLEVAAWAVPGREAGLAPSRRGRG